MGSRKSGNGSTVHYVDSGIDTGPTLIRTQLPVHRGAAYEQIVRSVLTLSGELMALAWGKLRDGDVEAIPQDIPVGETLRAIAPELLAEARSRLAEEQYSHFVDGQTGPVSESGPVYGS